MNRYRSGDGNEVSPDGDGEQEMKNQMKGESGRLRVVNRDQQHR